MSGDHNMHQKPRSYLDDFECPRCGHCCNSDLARVGEVGVWGEREWVGLTDDEVAQAMYRADAIITGPMQFRFAKEIEAKLKEKNHG